MKKLKFSHVMLFLICLFALLLTAASPFQTEAPPVPEPLKAPEALGLFLTAIVGFVLTNGLKSLSLTLQKRWAWFPDLAGLGATTTTTIVTTLILYINAILAAMPPGLLAPTLFLGLPIVGTLAAFGIHFTLKGFQPANNAQNTK